jgi:hypothetical protein
MAPLCFRGQRSEGIREHVENLWHYAASWSAWWPKRPSSTAALT